MEPLQAANLKDEEVKSVDDEDEEMTPLQPKLSEKELQEIKQKFDDKSHAIELSSKDMIRAVIMKAVQNAARE